MSVYSSLNTILAPTVVVEHLLGGEAETIPLASLNLVSSSPNVSLSLSDSSEVSLRLSGSVSTCSVVSLGSSNSSTRSNYAFLPLTGVVADYEQVLSGSSSDSLAESCGINVNLAPSLSSSKKSVVSSSEGLVLEQFKVVLIEVPLLPCSDSSRESISLSLASVVLRMFVALLCISVQEVQLRSVPVTTVALSVRRIACLSCIQTDIARTRDSECVREDSLGVRAKWHFEFGELNTILKTKASIVSVIANNNKLGWVVVSNSTTSHLDVEVTVKSFGSINLQVVLQHLYATILPTRVPVCVFVTVDQEVSYILTRRN